MPVTTRKAKPQASSYAEEAIESSDDEITTFAKVFGGTGQTTDGDNEFRKKAKPKSRKLQNPGPAPSVPPMSDDEGVLPGKSSELGEYYDFDSTRKPVKAPPEIPDTIKIQLTGGPRATTINLNLADLFLRRKQDSIEVQYDNDETLVAEDAEPSKHRSKRAKMLHDARAQKVKESTKKGFTDLPYELRLGIYRRSLVKEAPLDFATQRGFSRSGQFLSTCKLVNEEGRVIMYGENSFHFGRTAATRGAYFEAQWKEIGFKDVRRFLESIGPANVALMKYVSFVLRDAAPSLTMYLDEEEVSRLGRPPHLSTQT